MSIIVRPATNTDVNAIASIHRSVFERQRDSEVWVAATLAASPRFLAYVLTIDEDLIGYIFWAQKSGIRPATVIELDQIAVSSSFQGRGFGEQLIRDSLAQVEARLRANQQSLKSILVSTRDDNAAQRLYARVLGAKVMTKVENLYSATEVFMVANREPM